MKIRLLSIFLGLFYLITPHQSQAFLLEEHEISSKDKSCSIRYLTEKNVKSWYFKTDNINCTDDGWLDGYHEITIYNAFSQPIEKLYGYFSYGYWTSSAHIKTPFLTRFSEEVGVQKATFLLFKDDEHNMDYIGQMTSIKNSKGKYSEFQVCNPFKLLIVTDQIPLFANKKKQQIIFRNIKKQVRSICPMEERVMLFVSPVLEPTQDDIVFYSELDLNNHSSKNVWREEALKKSGFYDETLEVATLTNLFQPQEKDLSSIREALSRKIDLIPFKNVSEKQYPTQFEEIHNINLFSNNKPLKHSKDTEIYDEPILEKKQTIQFEEMESEQTNTFDEIPTIEKDFSFPKPNKAYPYNLKKKQKENEPIAHLVVLSKVKKTPVPVSFKAKVIIDNNKVITTEPFSFLLKNKRLRNGCYTINGDLNANNPQNGLMGEINVKSATLCDNDTSEEE